MAARSARAESSQRSPRSPACPTSPVSAGQSRSIRAPAATWGARWRQRWWRRIRPFPARTWAASREPSSAERFLVAAEAEPHPPLSGLVDQRRVAGANHKTNASPAALNAFLLLTAAIGSSIGGHTGVRLGADHTNRVLGDGLPRKRGEMGTEAPSPLLPTPTPGAKKAKAKVGGRLALRGTGSSSGQPDTGRPPAPPPVPSGSPRAVRCPGQRALLSFLNFRFINGWTKGWGGAADWGWVVGCSPRPHFSGS